MIAGSTGGEQPAAGAASRAMLSGPDLDSQVVEWRSKFSCTPKSVL
jgi:hypothetical protein